MSKRRAIMRYIASEDGSYGRCYVNKISHYGRRHINKEGHYRRYYSTRTIIRKVLWS